MDYNWTKSEKQISKKIFNLALQRDYEKLYEHINSKTVDSPEQVWKLQDYLNKKAKEFDEKYDYRYSQLLIVFMRLVNEGLLTIDELDGLSFFYKRYLETKIYHSL
jgi:hypothetical protein